MMCSYFKAMEKQLLLCIGTLVLIASCGGNDLPDATASSGGNLDRFFTEEAHEGAALIHVARQSASPGDEITLQGMVMGRTRPFVEGRAAFVLGDRTLLTPCNEKDGDSCATPWDVCCDSSEDKRNGTATIQIVDADGRVIGESLRGVNDLVELSSVTLKGTVAEGSGEDALIVNATEIHVLRH